MTRRKAAQFSTFGDGKKYEVRGVCLGCDSMVPLQELNDQALCRFCVAQIIGQVDDTIQTDPPEEIEA